MMGFHGCGFIDGVSWMWLQHRRCFSWMASIDGILRMALSTGFHGWLYRWIDGVIDGSMGFHGCGWFHADEASLTGFHGWLH
jgi:hypothetical protein